MPRCPHSLDGLRQVEDEIQHKQTFEVHVDPTWEQTTERDRFITRSMEAIRETFQKMKVQETCQTTH